MQIPIKIITRRPHLQEDAKFLTLGMLQANPDLTKRKNLQKLGISASRLHYFLKALI